MPLFPLFAHLAGREVPVVGGGEQVEALLQAGRRCRSTPIRSTLSLSQWLSQGGLRRREGDFDPAWLDEVWLVVAATDDRAFNARLAAEAGRRLANIVDDAELSMFQIPRSWIARAVSGFCIGK